MHRSWTRRFGLTILALAFAALPLSAAAQATGGVITGIVSDAQGGVLPGVTVTVRNADSGVTRSVVTETDGRYRIPTIPPGRYTLTGELQGFAPTEIANLTVTIGLEMAANVTLQLVGVNESVTVTAQAPIVETSKTEVSGVITQQQIESIPLPTRQPVGLALLMPGTSQDAIRPRKFNANVGAGAYSNAGAFLVDGVWNKESCTGDPRQNFPQASIQEFKVNVSQASAEYGWTASGVVSMVTKSGTNRFSGEAFEYFRHESLNRPDVFQQQAIDNGGAKPTYRRNQFGGAFGGPLIVNRLHFFAAAERTKEDKTITVNTGRPQFYSSLEGTFPTPEYDNTALVRTDLQINGQQNLFVRWAWENADYTCDACGGTNAFFTADGVNQPRQAITGGHSWILSSRAVNDLRVQWAYYHFYAHPPGAKAPGELYDYSAERTAPLTQIYQFPSLNWGSNSTTHSEMSVRQIRDDFTITMSGAGTHTLKFGGAITDMPWYDDVPPALGTWRFTVDQPFDPGNLSAFRPVAGSLSQFTAAMPPTRRFLPNRHNEIYVQDEWRPRSNLTVNLGLRYDRQTRIWDEELDINDKEMFPTTGTNLQVPYVDFPSRGDTNNLGPRLGVAYDLHGDGRAVVRAGWGIYYNPIFASIVRGEQANFRQTNVTITNPAYPDPYGGRDPLSFASTAPQNLVMLDNGLRNPLSKASTVGFSQALTTTIAVHVDGVFNKGTEVPMTTDINYRPGSYSTATGAFVASGPRPLTQFARIDEVQSIGYLNYNALLVRLEKQYDRRYQYLVSYTLAKGDGNITFANQSGRVTQAENPGLDIGPSQVDRRHALVTSGSLLLPYGLQLGGIYTFRTTTPFSAVAGRDLNGDANVTDFVPGTTRATGNRDNEPLMAAVNAWRATNGLAALPLSQIDTNQYSSLDMRLTKTFSLGDSRKLDVIGQLFNVLGTTNLGGAAGAGYVTNALSDSFGRILTAFNRQQGEIAVRVAW